MPALPTWLFLLHLYCLTLIDVDPSLSLSPSLHFAFPSFCYIVYPVHSATCIRSLQKVTRYGKTLTWCGNNVTQLISYIIRWATLIEPLSDIRLLPPQDFVHFVSLLIICCMWSSFCYTIWNNKCLFLL